MKIVLTGASGLIGPALRTALRSHGHDVLSLVRREPSGPDEGWWDPSAGRLDPELLADAGAVVCLSGVGVGDKRWTEKYKKEIVESRVDSVGTVARTMAQLGRPPVLVSASAVGYYGDAGEQKITEEAPAGNSFLAGVCQLWEGAASPAVEAGLRVTYLRTGLVLARDGGLLKRLSTIVKAGIGGKLGNGQQYMPWISLADEVAAIEFLIEHHLAGPVNLTAPAPARNVDFTKTLGHVLKRPTVIPVPGFAARIVLGQFSEDVLTGQNAVPTRLLDAGFTFTHHDLEQALRAELDH